MLNDYGQINVASNKPKLFERAFMAVVKFMGVMFITATMIYLGYLVEAIATQ